MHYDAVYWTQHFRVVRSRGIKFLVAPDGTLYVGSCHGRVPHGIGQMVSPDNVRVLGRWVDGELQGRAHKTWDSSEQYIGSMLDGARHGMGAYLIPGVGWVQGQWQGGRLHGLAVLSMGGSNLHCGAWRHGQRWGAGMESWAIPAVQFAGSSIGGYAHGARAGFHQQQQQDARAAVCRHACYSAGTADSGVHSVVTIEDTDLVCSNTGYVDGHACWAEHLPERACRVLHASTVADETVCIFYDKDGTAAFAAVHMPHHPDVVWLLLAATTPGQRGSVVACLDAAAHTALGMWLMQAASERPRCSPADAAAQARQELLATAASAAAIEGAATSPCQRLPSPPGTAADIMPVLVPATAAHGLDAAPSCVWQLAHSLAAAQCYAVPLAAPAGPDVIGSVANVAMHEGSHAALDAFLQRTAAPRHDARVTVAQSTVLSSPAVECLRLMRSHTPLRARINGALRSSQAGAWHLNLPP